MNNKKKITKPKNSDSIKYQYELGIDYFINTNSNKNISKKKSK